MCDAALTAYYRDHVAAGVPAQLPERLTVPRWPDFMGKEVCQIAWGMSALMLTLLQQDDHSYRCNHVVGQLFRMVRLFAKEGAVSHH